MKIIPPLLIASGLAALCSGDWNWDHWSVHQEDTIEKTLNLSNPLGRLVVKNVQGYVHVIGTDGSQVKLTVHRSIRAASGKDIQEAKNNVRLEMFEEPDEVSIAYKTSRDRDWDSDHDRYQVIYDMDIEAPRQVQAIVSDVSGDIRVEKSAGEFDVRNVSGTIHMADISGSGNASTVNGTMDIHFSKNPSHSSDFRTVNGKISVFFQPNLSANVKFSTLNGDIYSAFDVALHSAPAGTMHRIDRTGSGVVGSGGPDLSFKTINGSIELHKANSGGNSGA